MKIKELKRKTISELELLICRDTSISDLKRVIDVLEEKSKEGNVEIEISENVKYEYLLNFDIPKLPYELQDYCILSGVELDEKQKVSGYYATRYDYNRNLCVHTNRSKLWNTKGRTEMIKERIFIVEKHITIFKSEQMNEFFDMKNEKNNWNEILIKMIYEK